MQVRDYIAATSSCPSGALVSTQGQEVETQPSPSKPHPDDEPHMDLTWDIRELSLDQLWEVLRGLQMKIARREELHCFRGHPGVVYGFLGVTAWPKWMTRK